MVPNPSPPTRGLHSSSFQLNLSALYGIVGGARRNCVARVKGVLGSFFVTDTAQVELRSERV